jgi:hypothetical protein
VTAKQARYFEVYERQSIEVAPKDKLLLMSNRRDAAFQAVNGELVTVSRIDEHSRIHLQDGRILPTDYKEFTHGYAVTAHGSQGQSVDSVVILGDGMHKELFYVAASRGRESITLVTSDKELLRETIGQSDSRQSASELAFRATVRSLESGTMTLRDAYRNTIIPEQSASVADNVNQISKQPTSLTMNQGGAACDRAFEQNEMQSHSPSLNR